MPIMEQFLSDVENYAAAWGLQPSTVIQRAAGQSGAIWAKWKAREASPTLVTADRVRAYMDANPPPLPEAGEGPDGPELREAS